MSQNKTHGNKIKKPRPRWAFSYDPKKPTKIEDIIKDFKDQADEDARFRFADRLNGGRDPIRFRDDEGMAPTEEELKAMQQQDRESGLTTTSDGYLSREGVETLFPDEIEEKSSSEAGPSSSITAPKGKKANRPRNPKKK